MRNRPLIALPFAALLMLPCASHGQVEGTFTLPNSVLLFQTRVPGVSGEPLLVVSAAGTVVVREPDGFLGQISTPVPALAPTADRVAWGLSLHDDTRKERYRSVLGVYSLLDKTWKTYGDFCWGSGIGSKVFSPDGTKIAFTSQAASSSENRLCDFNPSVLQILDIATGKLTPVPYSGYVIENARLSWSPDGKYLAGEFWRSQSTSQIVVIDLESGSGKVIADGTDPSWSPDGDWIAYGDQMKQKCILIHPDGSGAKLVRDLSKRRGGVWLSAGGALWSPDEKKLLFDDVQVDSLGDVTILDLPSGKETKLPRRSRFVWGWAAERR